MDELSNETLVSTGYEKVIEAAAAFKEARFIPTLLLGMSVDTGDVVTVGFEGQDVVQQIELLEEYITLLKKQPSYTDLIIKEGKNG